MYPPNSAADLLTVTRSVRRRANPAFQFVVISLKGAFYEKARGLVGIWRDVPAGSSKTLTLDVSFRLNWRECTLTLPFSWTSTNERCYGCIGIALVLSLVTLTTLRRPFGGCITFNLEKLPVAFDQSIIFLNMPVRQGRLFVDQLLYICDSAKADLAVALPLQSDNRLYQPSSLSVKRAAYQLHSKLKEASLASSEASHKRLPA